MKLAAGTALAVGLALGIPDAYAADDLLGRRGTLVAQVDERVPPESTTEQDPMAPVEPEPEGTDIENPDPMSPSPSTPEDTYTPPPTDERQPEGVYPPTDEERQPEGVYPPTNEERQPEGVYPPTDEERQPEGVYPPTDEERPTEDVDRGEARVEDEPAYMRTEGTRERRGPGFSLMAGGGVISYLDEDTRDATTDYGGLYTARLGIGTRSPIGFEVGYIGTAQNINALGIDEDAMLMSNGVEGAVRLNIGNAAVQPYVIGGAAWRRYSVTNADFNTSSVRDEDDILEFPVGAGLAFKLAGFVLDARGAYRIATDDDLLRTDIEGPGLDAWDVTLKAGVEF